MNGLIREIRQLADGITHVSYFWKEEKPETSILISPEFLELKSENTFDVKNGDICFYKNGQLILQEIEHSLEQKEIFRYLPDTEALTTTKQTANGEVTCVVDGKQELERYSWEGKLQFEMLIEGMLLGLGQYEDGIYDYRGKKEYLYQNNMKIAMPFLISTAGFGILIDTESNLVFENKDSLITFTIDTTKNLSYYIFTGDDFDSIIYRMRELTGRASMLPRWTFGYIQSKERYKTGEELKETVEKFRELEIPIDCIVQDWLSWEGDLWGQKTVDTVRFPDFENLVKTLHQDHVHLMLSVWPNMSEKSENYKEFKEKNLLLPNANVYDAFSKEGRALYWKQCEEQLFKSGVDAWWCDNAEPFSDADWNGSKRRTEEERYEVVTSQSKKHMEWERVNSYGLYHGKGIYEHWRETTDEKRVVNLTRSSYLSGQRYGTILWSGDISARWDVLRNQVVEGIKVGLCGIPYWTLDIGGFFTVREEWTKRGCNNHNNPEMLWFWDGDYENGVQDKGYRELYTRWLQFGAFLPVFRSHGTDTPREPWNFPNEGAEFYNVIVKFIRLRYQLMPYIYSCGAMSHRRHYTMMRSLLFDFIEDLEAREIKDSYMFGPSFYVCPVMEPLYYEKKDQELHPSCRIRKVYLPKETGWYDYWTNEYLTGGQWIEATATLEIMPLYVKAGAIIPMSQPIGYADEKKGEVCKIHIYDGADGCFELYNDEGDGYAFEKGNYAAIKIRYFSKERKLQFEKVQGTGAYQSDFTICLIGKKKESSTLQICYKGEKQDWYL